VSDYARQNRDKFAHDLANGIELSARRHEAWAVKRPDHVALWPPQDFRHDVTGRRQLEPDPPLISVGRYFRRARLLAGLSQQRLADKARVSQSSVSRTERGLGPAMGFEHFVDMTVELDRLFPFGVCPHDHECPWQPIKPPEHQTTAVERLVEKILSPAGFEASDDQEAENAESFVDDIPIKPDELQHDQSQPEDFRAADSQADESQPDDLQGDD
jgi:hypothetical protein